MPWSPGAAVPEFSISTPRSSSGTNRFILARFPRRSEPFIPRHRSFECWRQGPRGPSTILDHGVNPGLVSHFVKAALVDLAGALGHPGVGPSRLWSSGQGIGR